MDEAMDMIKRYLMFATESKLSHCVRKSTYDNCKENCSLHGFNRNAFRSR
jgi:hypothetical protein